MTAITAECIMGAEALLGLAWTEAERAQMLGNLDGQIASAVARRRHRLPNAVPMAQRFDPRLAHFAMPPRRPMCASRRSPRRCRATTPTSRSPRSRIFRTGSPLAR
jgi:hypothetical protein